MEDKCDNELVNLCYKLMKSSSKKSWRFWNRRDVKCWECQEDEGYALVFATYMDTNGLEYLYDVKLTTEHLEYDSYEQTLTFFTIGKV